MDEKETGQLEVAQNGQELSTASSPETFRPEELLPLAKQAMASTHGIIIKTNRPDVLIDRFKRLKQAYPEYAVLHPRRSQEYKTYESEVWLIKRKVTTDDQAPEAAD